MVEFFFHEYATVIEEPRRRPVAVTLVEERPAIELSAGITEYLVWFSSDDPDSSSPIAVIRQNEYVSNELVTFTPLLMLSRILLYSYLIILVPFCSFQSNSSFDGLIVAITSIACSNDNHLIKSDVIDHCMDRRITLRFQEDDDNYIPFFYYKKYIIFVFK